MFRFRMIRLFIFVFLLCANCVAQREPVLKQIDLPHAYYYREMYLPQLTTGPSAAAWSPDSRTLIYSMAGSLWRQDVNSTIAEQLTAGPGYDYQPDWSADGRWVAFSRYIHDAMELWLLDLHDGRTRQLTSGSAVNLEPRFSPDGKRLAFVSTSFKGHFHVFAGKFENGELSDVQQLTPENVSSLPRYYYSKVDHEISPVWSHDGSEILFISNRGHIHGTGGFWRMKAQPGAAAHEIHYEETTWKARPDLSPDGKRIVYASYLGRSWHQLWVMPEEGGDAFPISYGDYDNINPRWSPDGSKIAFISNHAGNTSLSIQTIPGGAQNEIVAYERKYLTPMGKLLLRVTDPSGKSMAARVFITAEDGRAYAPDDGWMEADDSFDRKERPFEAHYFVTKGISQVAVPAGKVRVGVMRGFEYRFEELSLEVQAGKTSEATVSLRQIEWKSPEARWVSGDAHVHMNYAGTYRNTPSHLIEQAAAENLSIIENLVVNKEQRFPDIAYFSPKLDPASDDDRLLQHAQEFHTSYWGHLGLLNLTRNLILPGYAAYPNTEAGSLFPANANVADLAHEQGALVGYVHPLESVPDPVKDAVTFELPADVALGKVDYIEVVGFSDHKSTAEVWYKLLNCGFRLPTAAGTDFMGNYASLRGPIGLNRVYAEVPAGSLKLEPWLQSIKAGRTFATNGPLLRFELGGEAPGGEVHLDKKQGVFFKAALGSIVPVDYLQIVCNGKVARELDLGANRTSAYVEGKLPLESSGWCILRAFSDQAEYPILDLYPYATTSPVYVDIAGAPLRNTEDAAYFVAWMGRLITAAQSSTTWNTETEQQAVLAIFQKARQKYENIAKLGP
ncbi:MAG TPA: CehA/McbA family metallohydrolase [Candidatus Udaeobacter sp.]|nr:CehA/McbA family metallohydrolase [Candidatus Udaeobacter sp.]